jgi:hypothetical protein
MTPTHAGYYWAKIDQSELFNAIAVVDGKAPFLRIKALDLSTNLIRNLHDHDVTEWGPEIPTPDQY